MGWPDVDGLVRICSAFNRRDLDVAAGAPESKGRLFVQARRGSSIPGGSPPFLDHVASPQQFEHSRQCQASIEGKIGLLGQSTVFAFVGGVGLERIDEAIEQRAPVGVTKVEADEGAVLEILVAGLRAAIDR
jgi:hypothetical protein